MSTKPQLAQYSTLTKVLASVLSVAIIGIIGVLIVSIFNVNTARAELFDAYKDNQEICLHTTECQVTPDIITTSVECYPGRDNRGAYWILTYRNGSHLRVFDNCVPGTVEADPDIPATPVPTTVVPEQDVPAPDTDLPETGSGNNSNPAPVQQPAPQQQPAPAPAPQPAPQPAPAPAPSVPDQDPSLGGLLCNSLGICLSTTLGTVLGG